MRDMKKFYYAAYRSGQWLDLEVPDEAIAVLVDSDGDVVDWFTFTTSVETAINFANDAEHFYVDPRFENLKNILAAIRERKLHNDCFGNNYPVFTIWPKE